MNESAPDRRYGYVVVEGKIFQSKEGSPLDFSAQVEQMRGIGLDAKVIFAFEFYPDPKSDKQNGAAE